jgi:hypothetical protein
VAVGLAALSLGKGTVWLQMGIYFYMNGSAVSTGMPSLVTSPVWPTSRHTNARMQWRLCVASPLGALSGRPSCQHGCFCLSQHLQPRMCHSRVPVLGGLASWLSSVLEAPGDCCAVHTEPRQAWASTQGLSQVWTQLQTQKVTAPLSQGCGGGGAQEREGEPREGT